jgi:signal transduction histidine kinase
MSAPLLSRDEERLRALYHLSVELSALQPLDSVLDIALQHCLQLTGSEFGFIGLVSEKRKAMDVVAVQGFHADASFYERFHLIPLRPNIFARVVLDNYPIRSANAFTDPHRVGQPHGHPPVMTFLGVPLRQRDKPIGMIGVANRAEAYEESDEHLLMTYAAQIAIVITNAQLYDELKAARDDLEQKVLARTGELQAAQDALSQKASQLQALYQETLSIQENERQRIAQDMHDGINQLLIGAMLELQSARARLNLGAFDKANESLDAVQLVLHDVEAEIKRVIYDLRPPSLDTLGFVPALRRYIKDFQAYANLECHLTVEGKIVRLPAHSEVNIYRVLQESLQNVYTHAKAKQVQVRISFLPDKVSLVISDDGIGFDIAKLRAKHRHFGLITIQERAQSLHGEATIESQLGSGTRILFSIPIGKGLNP